MKYFDDCVEEVGLDLESKNIELSYFNSVENDVLVIADAEQLKRVINNIVGNSIKYMDKPKAISASVSKMWVISSRLRSKITDEVLRQRSAGNL